MLLTTLVTSFFEITNDAWYFIGNITGYSILGNLIFIYIFFFTRRYCWFTKLSVLGLLAMNIFDIIAGIFLMENYDLYSYVFTISISTICIFLGIYYTLERNDIT